MLADDYRPSHAVGLSTRLATRSRVASAPSPPRRNFRNGWHLLLNKILRPDATEPGILGTPNPNPSTEDSVPVAGVAAATGWSIWANSPEPEAHNRSLRITPSRSTTAPSRRVVQLPCTRPAATPRAQEPQKVPLLPPHPSKPPPSKNLSLTQLSPHAPPAAKRFVQSAFRVGSATRKALSILPPRQNLWVNSTFRITELLLFLGVSWPLEA